MIKKVLMVAPFATSFMAVVHANNNISIIKIPERTVYGKATRADLDKPKMSNNLSVRYGAGFRGVFKGGSDVINVPYEGPYASAVGYVRSNMSGGRGYVGSGMFVSPRVFLTVAHNYLDDKTRDFRSGIISRDIVLGSNSDANAKLTGTKYNVDKSQVKFWNQSGYSYDQNDQNKDWKHLIKFENDLAAVIFPEAMQFLSPYNKAEFNSLASDDEFDKVVDGSNFTMYGYPGSKDGSKDPNVTEGRVFKNGKLYSVTSKVTGYTDPKTGKPFYYRRDKDGNYTNEKNPKAPLFDFYNSSWGGFSGSGLLNDKGHLIGVLQYGRESVYPEGHAKAGQAIPDSDPANKSNGGIILSEEQRAWLRGLIEQYKVVGWKQNEAGQRFYFKEDQHLARSETLEIDGHDWKFDAEGHGTDLGPSAANLSGVGPALDKLKVLNQNIKSKNKALQIEVNSKLNEINRLKSLFETWLDGKKRNLKELPQETVNSEVAKVDKLIEDYRNLILKIQEDITDTSSVESAISKFNGFRAVDTNSVELKRELSDKLTEINNHKKLLETYKGEHSKSELPQAKVNEGVAKVDTLIKAYNDILTKIESYNKLEAEYNTKLNEINTALSSVKSYTLKADHVRDGVEYDNFIKSNKAVSDTRGLVTNLSGSLADKLDKLKSINVESLAKNLEDAYNKLLVQKEVSIPYDTKYVDDDSMNEGVRITKVRGQDGLKIVIPGRADRIVKNKVDEVVHVGTMSERTEKEYNATEPTLSVRYADTREYGKVNRSGYPHAGLEEVTKVQKLRKGVPTGEPKITKITLSKAENGDVELGTIGEDVYTESVVIDYKTEYVDSKDIKRGEMVTSKSGKNGYVEKVYTWKTIKGRRVGQPKVVENIIVKVENEIVKRGV